MSEDDSPVALTGIDDQAIRNSCQWIANFINDVVQLPFYEPHGSIDEIDEKFKTVIFPKPLTYTHQLIQFLLEGVRDSMLAASQIFSTNSSSRIPITALTRQITEYCASAYYLSDPSDSPEMRISKMLFVYRSSLNEKGFGHPDLHKLYDEANRILSDWQNESALPKTDGPGKITEAVKKLFTGFPDESLGREYYRKLSGLTHGSPRDLTQLLEITWRDNPQMQAMHYGEAVADMALGFRSAFAVMLRVITLYSGKSEFEIAMTRIRLRHFGLGIEEVMVMLGGFWSRVPKLTDDAYTSKGLEPPRLSDIFKDGKPHVYDYLNEPDIYGGLNDNRHSTANKPQKHLTGSSEQANNAE